MLILKTLQHGPLHGYAVAQRIHLISKMCCGSKNGRFIQAEFDRVMKAVYKLIETAR